MLKFEYDPKHGCHIENICTLGDTINGVCTLVHDLYCSMQKHQPIAAMFFREAILELMTSEKSPMWDASQGTKADFEVFMAMPPKEK